jgi:hypothetical protein
MTYPYATNTYVGWDFEYTWAEDVNNAVNDGYPYLWPRSTPTLSVTPTESPVDTPTNTPSGVICTHHDSDYSPADWHLDMIGVQLLIQRFNTGGAYHCGTPSAQDGYAPGSGDQSCGPHSADYNGNWQIELLEAQRAVQFFNVGSYHCEPGTVDGYAPGGASATPGVTNTSTETATTTCMPIPPNTPTPQRFSSW